AADKQEVYEALIRIAARLGRQRDAFEGIERAKSRAFVDLLAQRQLQAPMAIAIAPLAKYAELDSTQRALEAEVMALQSDTARADDKAVRQKTRELRSIADEREKLTRDLGANKTRVLDIT